MSDLVKPCENKERNGVEGSTHQTKCGGSWGGGEKKGVHNIFTDLKMELRFVQSQVYRELRLLKASTQVQQNFKINLMFQAVFSQIKETRANNYSDVLKIFLDKNVMALDQGG